MKPPKAYFDAITETPEESELLSRVYQMSQKPAGVSDGYQ